MTMKSAEKNTQPKTVPLYSAKDWFRDPKTAWPVGRVNNPDAIGPMIVDRETWDSIFGKDDPKKNGDRHE